MTKQVKWSKFVLETFIEEAVLSKDEEFIIRTRVAGWSRTQQAQKLDMSISTVDKHIANLKRKYDNAAKYNPLLPPRKASAQETWQDAN